MAVWAICAETEEEALRLSASFGMMMLLLYRGRLIPVPPVERALEFLKSEGDIRELPVGRRILTGTPAAVRSGLESVAAEHDAEEVFVVNILYDHAARRHSYQLIAEEFGITTGRLIEGLAVTRSPPT